MSKELREALVTEIVDGVCGMFSAYGGTFWETKQSARKIVEAALASHPSEVELVQDKLYELRSFLGDMRRDAVDSRDPQIATYADAIEQYVNELAALTSHPSEVEAHHVGWIAGHCSDPLNCPACKTPRRRKRYDV